MPINKNILLVLSLILLLVSMTAACSSFSGEPSSGNAAVITTAGREASESAENESTDTSAVPDEDSACNNHLFDDFIPDKSPLSITKYDGFCTVLYEISNKFISKEQIISQFSACPAEKLKDSTFDPGQTLYTMAVSDGRSSLSNNVRYLIFSEDTLYDSLDSSLYQFDIDMDQIIESFYKKSHTYSRSSWTSPSYNSALYPLQIQEGQWNARYLSSVLDTKKTTDLIWSLEKTGDQHYLLTIENTHTEEYISLHEFTLQVFLNQNWFYVPINPGIIPYNTVETEFTYPQYGRILVKPGETINLDLDLSLFYDTLPEGEYRISFGDLVIDL